VRENAATIDIDLVANADIVAQNGNVLQPCPLTNGAIPANDGALDPRVVLDLGAGEQDAALQSDAVADNHAGADGDIGPYSAVLANFGRGVDEDIAAVDVRLARGRQELGAPLGQRRQVQASSRQEILGLAHIHPESLEIEAVQLSVAHDRWEGLLLDAGGLELDALQYRRVEYVYSGVDAVSDELDGLLDEAVDAAGVVGLMDDDAVLGRLLDLGDDDGALFAVGLMELGELLEGVVADDVRVEHEERRLVLKERLLGQFQRACGAEGFGLDREGDVDAEFLRILVISIIRPMVLECRARGVGSRLPLPDASP
jgi:hypothetical protein